MLNILDAIEALGSVRNFLPGEHSNAWVGALGSSVDLETMAKGTAYSLVLFGIFVLIATLRFDCKDITS